LSVPLYLEAGVAVAAEDDEVVVTGGGGGGGGGSGGGGGGRRRGGGGGGGGGAVVYDPADPGGRSEDNGDVVVSCACVQGMRERERVLQGIGINEYSVLYVWGERGRWDWTM
jgi:hypothetical protein